MQGMKERKIAMDLYMDDIHQSDRRGKRREIRREGRQREFLHLHMPLLLYEVSLLGHIGFSSRVLPHGCLGSGTFRIHHICQQIIITRAPGPLLKGKVSDLSAWPLACWGPKSLVCQQINSIKTGEAMTEKISYMSIKFLNKDDITQKKMTNKSLLLKFKQL